MRIRHRTYRTLFHYYGSDSLLITPPSTFRQPTLIQGGRVLSTGGDYVSNGPLVAAIAYLQTGACGFNGENCSLLETTLKNPTCAGCGSSTDVSLIAPHRFSVTTGFGYYNGCDGTGNNCE
jgi:rRNA maturation protein Nop10